MARFIFFGIVIYLFYRLVFDLVIPLINTTSRLKKQFRNMQNNMNGQNNSSGPGQHEDTSQQHDKTPVGDYIDFEEVK